MGDELVSRIIKKLTSCQNNASTSQTEPQFQLPFFPNDGDLIPAPPPVAVKPEPEPVPAKYICSHSGYELSLDPCLICNRFCNCFHIHDYKPPDVFVRSVDHKIVRLSGWTVRASQNLNLLVNKALKNHAEGGAKLEVKRMIITSDDDSGRSGIKYKEDPDYVGSGSDSGIDDDSSDGLSLRNSPVNRPAERKKIRMIDDNDLVEWEDRVLVLFDTESNRPTLGITEKILLKVDYFVCSHLDEIDSRVESKIISKEFYDNSVHVEPPDADMLFSFKYQDWEEEFFNVDAGTLHGLYQASQELLIWDLSRAMVKWDVLFRGFPLRMVNGLYDLIEDPDYMNWDGKNIFGLYNTPYYNPKVKKCRHKSDNLHAFNPEDFLEPCFVAKWWLLKWKPAAKKDLEV